MYNFKVLSSIRSYSVTFEDDFEKSLFSELTHGDFIIIDNALCQLYSNKFDEILKRHNHQIIKATEDQKSYLQLATIIENLIQNGFRKNNRLIAIGGGITQDITAFIASIMFRGVNWLFYPTTLLSQGDSCIGSKTSINFGKYKNQLGNFYPPEKVIIDTSFLGTLPDKEMHSGLGEMCHFFAISGEKDFDRFSADYSAALKDMSILQGLIARSLEIKKKVIEIDEFDRGQRQIFNYGHSFGHAIESLTNYSVPHGIAVSYGMDMANYVSFKLGYIDADYYGRIRSFLKQIWGQNSIGELNQDHFEKALLKDKKNIGNDLGLVLTRGLGKMFIDRLPMDDKFSGWLREYFTEQLN